MELIKACFRHASSYKNAFSNAHCVVPISVGQAYHEGEKFSATLKLINQNFKKCTIIICDSLQRHTLKYQHNLSHKEAYQQSLENGDAWLNRSKHCINQLIISCDIKKWDAWLTHPDYQEAYQQAVNLYQNSAVLRDAFKKTILHFYSRTHVDLTNKSFLDSQKYIIEECTVSLLWMKENYHFEVYPSRRCNALCVFYALAINSINPNMLQFLQIRFKHKHKPQRLYYQHVLPTATITI